MIIQVHNLVSMKKNMYVKICLHVNFSKVFKLQVASSSKSLQNFINCMNLIKLLIFNYLIKDNFLLHNIYIFFNLKLIKNNIKNNQLNWFLPKMLISNFKLHTNKNSVKAKKTYK